MSAQQRPKRQKCAPPTVESGGEPTFCRSMDERLNPEANHGRGLTLLVITDLEKDEKYCLGVFFKKSEKDAGLMLNRCPWCGERVCWERLRVPIRTQGDAVLAAESIVSNGGEVAA